MFVMNFIHNYQNLETSCPSVGELYITKLGFPGGTNDKESVCQCRSCKRREFNLWVWKILWRRKWQPTPVFLPGESHGQRSLWVTKSQTQLSMHAIKSNIKSVTTRQWNIQTVLKQNELLSHEKTWRQLKCILPSERRSY